ncbi:MAG: universal stress protein, partial [Methanobrevibacter sp.]|nr:universal stress protein [Methanobrevibacter sp.]
SVAGRLTSSAFQSRKKVKKINEKLKKDAHKFVDNMAAKFDESINVKKMVVVGFPAETINQVADEEDADLIVISSSGKSGIHKFVIGSVAEKVLKNSEIDVLLVHND